MSVVVLVQGVCVYVCVCDSVSDYSAGSPSMDGDARRR